MVKCSHFIVLLVKGTFEIVFGSLARIETSGTEVIQALRCILAVGSNTAASLSFPAARSRHQVNATMNSSIVQLQGIGILHQRANFHPWQTAFGTGQQGFVVTQLIRFFLLMFVRGHRPLFKTIINAVDVIVNTIIIKIITNIQVIVFVINVLFLINNFSFNLHIQGFPSYIKSRIDIFLANQSIHIETNNLSHSVGTKALYVIKRVVIRSYFVI